MGPYPTYIDTRPNIRISAGVAHMCQPGGDLPYSMPVSVFRAFIEEGRLVLARWDTEVREVITFPGKKREPRDG